VGDSITTIGLNCTCLRVRLTGIPYNFVLTISISLQYLEDSTHIISHILLNPNVQEIGAIDTVSMERLESVFNTAQSPRGRPWLLWQTVSSDSSMCRNIVSALPVVPLSLIRPIPQYQPLSTNLTTRACQAIGEYGSRLQISPFQASAWNVHDVWWFCRRRRRALGYVVFELIDPVVLTLFLLQKKKIRVPCPPS
jgi:hypothetical protein